MDDTRRARLALSRLQPRSWRSDQVPQHGLGLPHAVRQLLAQRNGRQTASQQQRPDGRGKGSSMKLARGALTARCSRNGGSTYSPARNTPRRGTTGIGGSSRPSRKITVTACRAIVPARSVARTVGHSAHGSWTCDWPNAATPPSACSRISSLLPYLRSLQGRRDDMQSWRLPPWEGRFQLLSHARPRRDLGLVHDL
jgi:hypothetical protein